MYLSNETGILDLATKDLTVTSNMEGAAPITEVHVTALAVGAMVDAGIAEAG